jgi:hypothetical protein
MFRSPFPFEQILSHASGVATSDIRKVGTDPNHDYWIIYTYNWRKVRVRGLDAFRAHMLMAKGL